MKLYSICVGLNDKETKQQIIDSNLAFELVCDLCAANFDGSTIYPVKGVYKHFNGSTVIENSIKIEIYLDPSEDEKIYSLIDTLKHDFNQESILLGVSDSVLQFI